MVTDALEPVPPFEELKLAVFVIVAPHVAVDVGLVTCRINVVPAGKVNALFVDGVLPQVSDCGEPVVTAQEIPLGIVLPAASSVQVKPGADGEVSLSVPPVASALPEFASVTVKPC